MVFISAIYVFIAIEGKSIIEDNLTKFFKKEVKINQFKITVPLNITVSDIDVKDLGKIEYIYISPSVFGFLTAKVELNNVVVSKLKFVIKREKKPESVILAVKDSTVVVPKKRFRDVFKITIPLFIEHLKIIDASIEIIDTATTDNELKIKIDPLNFKIDKFAHPPRPIKTTYDLKGTIPWVSMHQNGLVEGSGWIDFAKKDMEGQLNFKDIDGIYLAPYYSSYVSLKELKIERTSLDLLTTLNATNNDLLIRSQLALKNLIFQKPEEVKDKSKDQSQNTHKTIGNVLEVFTAIGGKIVLNFNIKTKLDRPKMGIENIKVSIEDKLSKKELD